MSSILARTACLALASLCLVAITVQAQEFELQDSVVPEVSVIPSLAEYEPGEAGGEDEPEHIRDNAFLVEEAFNQEAGEVQHISNWIILWDRFAGGHSRDFANTYTMEIPLGSQKHQFSFTTQFLTAFEHLNNSAATQDADVGDTFLNYRLQLLASDEFLWCAPRASLIVPTADRRFGRGTGQAGYQFNLPISKYGDKFDFHFNSGFTIFPNVVATLPSGIHSPRYDLRGYNIGASVFYKPRVDLHFFVEALYLSNEEIDEFGARGDSSQMFINPGLRYAVCQFEQVEWVLGVSVPVGLTANSPDVGVFAYMSIEHIFRKVD
jgi:hypothetical protein